MSRAPLTVEDYVAGVRSGDRAALGRAITLVESRARRHQDMAQDMLLELLPHSGSAHRVGITGVPGVGKSTFIEALGTMLTARGHKVAVLAVDPSSTRTGGSILGDKTRMEALSIDPNAFIRPSPSSGRLGGVNRATRETMVVCEAAGFDVILVETVGAGQNETVVADMVDFFLVLMLAGAGDELQGIKKGVLELADMIAINKADSLGGHVAQQAVHQYRNAVHILQPPSPNWAVPVVTCSGLNGSGLEDLWSKVEEHWGTLSANGEIEEKRRRQRVNWMWSMVEDRLLDAVRDHPQVKNRLPSLLTGVDDGSLTVTLAATEILETFGVRAE
ncbi:methylmalonyl Co-A mutase-associated GTPase MeaB [Roseospira marina]|uniref:Methylmalonyl Co-A mutase-associated GTPase MeaB n=1 Tax=Roseospira marina TaxID=140057 RepID=A0A5M6IG09_9PROT|nr:methylmalonyl Co-A mutase-associated GTPase MeaB [Roseospira marina]KAA5607082.1 methylmalonyl Co-A mutase-associated GTPase MeaB [Roseospira marina]MBB4312725.1 LAO/AO transport system kinase [Roseospira marina]MBB5086502.1 LAO/AO transport system kinase [Roseospira marina]